MWMSGPFAVSEGGLNVWHRLVDVVDEGVAIRTLPCVAERDDVQQVELANTHRDEAIEQFRKTPDVPAIETHIDVDDGSTVGQSQSESLDLLVEGPRHADQGVVDPGVMAVDREGDLLQPGIQAAFQEFRVREHPPVRDSLDAAVSGRAAVFDERDVAGMNRGLAAGQNQPRRAVPSAVENAPFHLVVRDDGLVVRKRIQAEGALVVAQPGQAYPVALLVRGRFAIKLLGHDGMVGVRALDYQSTRALPRSFD
jgi:hypothetical protein